MALGWHPTHCRREEGSLAWHVWHVPGTFCLPCTYLSSAAARDSPPRLGWKTGRGKAEKAKEKLPLTGRRPHPLPARARISQHALHLPLRSGTSASLSGEEGRQGQDSQEPAGACLLLPPVLCVTHTQEGTLLLWDVGGLHFLPSLSLLTGMALPKTNKGMAVASPSPQLEQVSTWEGRGRLAGLCTGGSSCGSTPRAGKRIKQSLSLPIHAGTHL